MIWTSIVILVSTFSLRVSGRSSFLHILSLVIVFCPSYLIISYLSRWWKKEARLCGGAPPSVMSCHGFPGLREISVRNRNRNPTFATRCRGRQIFTSHCPSCLISFFPHAWSILYFFPILACEGLLAYGQRLQNLTIITKLNTKYNTIFYINLCGVFFTGTP